VWTRGELVVVAARHSVERTQDEACVWLGYYVFPSSICAHSIVSVPFHAEEME